MNVSPVYRGVDGMRGPDGIETASYREEFDSFIVLVWMDAGSRWN